MIAGQKVKLTVRNKYCNQRRRMQEYSCEVEILKVLPQSALVKLPNGTQKRAPTSQLSEIK